MGEILENTGAVCGVLIAGSLIVRLCPKDKMLGFVQALAALALLASMAVALVRVDWGLFRPQTETAANPELQEYIQGQYTVAAQEDWERYIEGLLASAGMQAKKIRAETDITEDGSIVLTKAVVSFRFDSDAQRARVLLENTLPGTTLEVTSGGD